MKPLSYISLFFLMLLSCKDRNSEKSPAASAPQWSATQIKKYYIDSIALRSPAERSLSGDSLNDFTIFSRRFVTARSANSTDPLIMGLEEDYIDTTQFDRNKEWLRITVDPFADIPYCIIAEKLEDRTRLTLKMTNGFGRSFPGYLTFFNTQSRPDSLFDSIAKDLTAIHFMQLGTDSTCQQVTDGEHWTIEAISKGQYHCVKRHSPDVCKSRETQTLLAIAEELKRISKFKEFRDLKLQTMSKVVGKD